MYIKDKHTGKVRLYGTDSHDSLRISSDGTCLTYNHLQCGEGSLAGDKEHSSYLFCDDEGQTPEEDDALCRHGADAYFNIGGFDNTKAVLDKIRAEIEVIDAPNYDFEGFYKCQTEVLKIIDEYKTV